MPGFEVQFYPKVGLKINDKLYPLQSPKDALTIVDALFNAADDCEKNAASGLPKVNFKYDMTQLKQKTEEVREKQKEILLDMFSRNGINESTLVIAECCILSTICGLGGGIFGTLSNLAK